MAYQRDMNAYAYRTRDDTPYDPRAPGPSDEHASYSRNYGPPRLTVAEKEERNARNKELKKYEEPNQTLFIRNLGIGTAEQTVLDAFGKYGDIMKTVNMLDKKGTYFLTYYDIRAAKQAKEELQDNTLTGRPMDIHFAVAQPSRDPESPDNNGTLFVLVEGRNVEEFGKEEIRELFQQWGDVCAVRDSKTANTKFIVYYDLRDSEKVYKEKNGYEWKGGRLKIRYALPRGPKPDEHGGRYHGAHRGSHGDRYRDAPPRYDDRRGYDRDQPPLHDRYDDRYHDARAPRPAYGGYSDYVPPSAPASTLPPAQPQMPSLGGLDLSNPILLALLTAQQGTQQQPQPQQPNLLAQLAALLGGQVQAAQPVPISPSQSQQQHQQQQNSLYNQLGGQSGGLANLFGAFGQQQGQVQQSQHQQAQQQQTQYGQQSSNQQKYSPQQPHIAARYDPRQSQTSAQTSTTAAGANTSSAPSDAVHQLAALLQMQQQLQQAQNGQK